MSLPLLLGECPSKAGDRYHAFPLSGAVGKRLCGWAGIESDADGSAYGRYYWPLREHFDCLNVIERYADANPWRTAVARERWTRWLLDRSDEERRESLTVVCLGRRAAEALGHDRPWGEWFEVGLLRVVTIPHPSGRNLLYNDPAMVAVAARVLHEAIAGTANLSSS
jgi:uracil-DNA glycosylase